MDTFVEPVVPATEPSATGLAPAEPAPAVTAAAPAGKVVDIGALTEAVARESGFVDQVVAEVGKIVVGQAAMIERILIGLLTGGHCLIEGVPGLAKTLTVKTLARSIRASFQRIQFTPDLLPADITGTIIYNMHSGEFTQKRGPLFANLVLADEINRAPAKVQSALLEAMQERQVTIGDSTHVLPDPFLVLATQNPIEQEGTFPLPEAQLDRFMLLIKVDYPTIGEERAMLDRMTDATPPVAREVVAIEHVKAARRVVSELYIDDRVRDYIVHLVAATRNPRQYGMAELVPLIEFGASPRATLFLATAARAHAFLRHRAYVTPEDIRAIAFDVLRHRVVTTYEAEAEEVTSEDVIRRVLERIPVP
ncbi:MAG: MoxR family ATPase [Kofleriaceae bacterium]|jgi:MoxR-like ATPase|nr:MoxR family ATPase [Kofleriaceae bacterium]MBP6838907.1 MoxR family ATPase [Kofleriaceae bacterium]MBP9203156.1 MoxR family ATPase [Kofleriaceae bacterium]